VPRNPCTVTDDPDRESPACASRISVPSANVPRQVAERLEAGARLDNRLAAMGGTRLNLEGYTEISGLCTHPDFQGRGLATALTLHIAKVIRSRGDRPFLHAYADNHGAIALYRKLGFDIWSEVNVAVVRRIS